MIISASRRTDIPAFHAEWMMNRLREGFVLVRNPFNRHQVSRVGLTRDNAEAIVFWTKNAGPMLPHLSELEDMGHRYMFQYTLTPYAADIEPGVDKRQALGSLLELSARIGPERVIWRYDPILLGAGWTAERHLRAFEAMASRMKGAAARCVISFVDLYAGVKRGHPWIQAPDEEQMRMMAREIVAVARKAGMSVSACAEKIDLTGEGVEPRGCIDPEDIAGLVGGRVEAERDAGQRSACRCIRSVDIGAYDTCMHGCAYCYARTERRLPGKTDADSPVLGGEVGPEDRISERREKKVVSRQETFLNI